MVYDPDRSRFEREARDSRDRSRRDSAWDDGRRNSYDHYRPPKRSSMSDRGHDNGTGSHRDRSEMSSPATSTSAKNDSIPDQSKGSPEVYPLRCACHGLTATGLNNRVNSSKSSKSHYIDLSNLSSPQSIRFLMDLLGDRMYWHRLREEAEKTRVKAQTAYDRHRLRPGGFISVSTILESQKKAVEDEISKIEGRMSETEAKIASTLGPLLQRSKSEAIDSAAPASSSTKDAGLDARITAAQFSIKHDLEAVLKKETRDMKESLEKMYESKFSQLRDSLIEENQQNVAKLESSLKEEHETVNELKALLTVENKRGDTLEQKLTALETKLENMSKTEASECKPSSTPATEHVQLVNELLDHTKEQDEKASLVAARLDRVEESLTAIDRLTEQMNNHSKAIRSHEERQNESASVITSLQSTVSTLPTEAVESLHSQLSRLKEQLQTPRTSQEPTPISDDRILQVLRPELDKNSKSMRESVNSIQSRLMPFLIEERRRGEEMEARVKEVSQQASALHDDMVVVKTEQSKSLEKFADQSSKFATDLTYHGSRIMSLDTRLDGVMRDNTSGFDGIHLQLQSLSTWQNNFDTRGLYKDILHHITATLPDGMTNQIRHLSQRVDGVESRLLANEDGPMKKRKLQGGTAKVVNGY